MINEEEITRLSDLIKAKGERYLKAIRTIELASKEISNFAHIDSLLIRELQNIKERLESSITEHNKQTLDIRETAEALGLSTFNLYRHIREEHCLQPHKSDANRFYYYRSELPKLKQQLDRFKRCK